MTIIKSISFQEERLEAIDEYISKDYNRSQIVDEALVLWLEKQKKGVAA